MNTLDSGRSVPLQFHSSTWKLAIRVSDTIGPNITQRTWTTQHTYIYVWRAVVTIYTDISLKQIRGHYDHAYYIRILWEPNTRIMFYLYIYTVQFDPTLPLWLWKQQIILFSIFFTFSYTTILNNGVSRQTTSLAKFTVDYITNLILCNNSRWVRSSKLVCGRYLVSIDVISHVGYYHRGSNMIPYIEISLRHHHTSWAYLH